jgi:hypothetical protein
MAGAPPAQVVVERHDLIPKNNGCGILPKVAHFQPIAASRRVTACPLYSRKRTFVSASGVSPLDH